MKPSTQPAAAPPERLLEYPAECWDGRTFTSARETIAEEVPVGLVYNGVPHAVLLATPQDLEEFALGFSLSEGIVQSLAEISGVRIAAHSAGVEVRVTLERTSGLEGRTRNLAGRTGCGLCGIQTLEHVLRPLAPVPAGVRIRPRTIHAAFQELQAHQRLHRMTGAVHAAAWSDAEGRLALAREDVGRHNAIDKVIGAGACRGLAFDAGFVILTSRASSEMVQKAATVGIPLVAAVSAPTALAIRIAEETGLTLIGFAREHRYTVYTHPRRIRPAREAALP